MAISEVSEQYGRDLHISEYFARQPYSRSTYVLAEYESRPRVNESNRQIESALDQYDIIGTTEDLDLFVPIHENRRDALCGLRERKHGEFERPAVFSRWERRDTAVLFG